MAKMRSTILKNKKYLNVLLNCLYCAALFLVYLVFINNSVGYEWDASNIAEWANRRLYLVPHQQNHLLQSCLGKLWFDVWKFFGYRDNSLMPLRVLSCIFGAFGATGFFILLRRIFQKNAIALFGSLGLAFSTFYWGFSTDLETHLLPSATFVFCLIIMFSLEDQYRINKIALLGFIHAACIYLSGIYIFFVPALALGILIVRSREDIRFRALISYFLSLIIFWLVPFLLIGVYSFYSPDSRLRYGATLSKHLFLWFRGLEKTIPFHWCGFPLFYPNLINYLGKYIPKAINIATCGLYLVFLVFVLKKIKFILRSFWRVIAVAIVMIIPYQIVLLVYEPTSRQRYTHFLTAIWLMLSCVTYPIFVNKSRMLRIIPWIFIALIFYTNLVYYIYPRHIVALGPVRQRRISYLAAEYEDFYKKGEYQRAQDSLKLILEIEVGTFGQKLPPDAVIYSEKLHGLLKKMGKEHEAGQLRDKLE